VKDLKDGLYVIFLRYNKHLFSADGFASLIFTLCALNLFIFFFESVIIWVFTLQCSDTVVWVTRKEHGLL